MDEKLEERIHPFSKRRNGQVTSPLLLPFPLSRCGSSHACRDDKGTGQEGVLRQLCFLIRGRLRKGLQKLLQGPPSPSIHSSSLLSQMRLQILVLPGRG
ncbi:hypothetical protein RHMOL_Rhmol13G0035300 [Rhododendron molle]|uniref:Uncharacterized protein n=1 Tax=Rhododendron molle TaxID=49168 RepID=A0ACC0L337_RHOML|nr:hypothetical protein RHMOL_Rhmol13G0035300 [Rhododendron molle]